jgi:GST-like protein
MYHLYTADTPNGRKATIAFEELGLPYEIRHVDLNKGEQHQPEFLSISPNNKIPAILRCEDGLAIFESGAILMHLASQAGRLLPQEEAARNRVLAWLFMQVGSVGPMLGQLWWFRHASSTPNEQALQRYTRETLRIYGVIERELARSAHIGGDDYSIADIAMFPWLVSTHELGIDLADFPHVGRWLQQVAARPAVQRGLELSRPVCVR